MAAASAAMSSCGTISPPSGSTCSSTDVLGYPTTGQPHAIDSMTLILHASSWLVFTNRSSPL